MKLYEYEAKAIFAKYGIKIPTGQIAATPSEAVTIIARLERPVFLKSQIKISGRGKTGGVREARDPEETRKIASVLLGREIQGLTIKSLLVEEKLEIDRQLYASISIDRQARCAIALASDRGGADIEEASRTEPRSVTRLQINPLKRLDETEALSLVQGFKLSPLEKAKFAAVFAPLYRIARDYDAELVEINPLIVTKFGDLVAADARMILDDNALFRRPDLAAASTFPDESTPREIEARKGGFSYIDLEGDIGIIGNGAGLVMATVDLVHLLSGRPADFLDIGGGANLEVIKKAVLLVLSKPEVKSILVNILGGITRCDIVAEGIVAGLRDSTVKKPIAVRMMGTNEAEGQAILRREEIRYYPDMEQAIRAVIQG